MCNIDRKNLYNKLENVERLGKKEMFKYNYVRDLVGRLIKRNDVPIQVELHPGDHCGAFKCRYCYGKNQIVDEGILTIDEYAQLLDDLIGKTELIAISGVITDPSSYPELYSLIKLIKERGFQLGIHTKGFLLDEKVLKLLNTASTEGDFITFSIDAPNKNIYNKLHGLPGNNGIFFEKAKQNIMSIYKGKIKNQSKLRINVAYLLFKNNSSKEYINDFIKIFKKYSDVIKFSIPQIPNIARPMGFLDNEEIVSTYKLLEEYEDEEVIVPKFKNADRDKNFKYCWSQRFNATIDKAGNVFPCPQVALKDYFHLSYGSLKRNRFWDIWNSDRRKKILNMLVDNMKCRICDRKDLAINIELSKILNINEFK